MAWGQKKRGLEDINARLAANDANLKSLTVMRFRRVEEEDVNGLAAALKANTVLQELSLACHPLPPGPAAALGAALAHNTALRHAALGDASLGDAGAAALAPGLAANQGLESLDLTHKGIGVEGARALASVLEAHPRLQALNLARNALGDAGAAALCGVPWRALRRLDLSKCELGPAAASALARAPGVAELASVALSGNGNLAGKEAGGALAELLDAGKALRELEVRGAKLGAAGAACFAPALARAPRLSKLDLGGCELGDQGCAAIADALRQQGRGENDAGSSSGTTTNSSGGDRTTFILSDNDLSAAVVLDLANALCERHAGSSGSTTTSSSGRAIDLHLDACELDAAAVAALARVPGLRALSVFGSRVPADAAAALSAALACQRHNGSYGAAGSRPFPALEELNLCGCRLELAPLLELLSALDPGSDTGDDDSGGDDGPLKLVELGANPGADEAEFEERVAALRERRPGLDVHWRAADGSSEGAPQPGGAPPPLR